MMRHVHRRYTRKLPKSKKNSAVDACENKPGWDVRACPWAPTTYT